MFNDCQRLLHVLHVVRFQEPSIRSAPKFVRLLSANWLLMATGFYSGAIADFAFEYIRGSY